MKLKYFIGVLVLILVVLIVGLPYGPSWLTGATLPVRQLVSNVVTSGGEFASWFGDVRQLSEERDRLAAERNELLSQLVELEAIERENASLREQLGVAETMGERDYLVAQMSGQVSQGGVNLLLVDQGSDDGVEVGATVMADGVLVGRVRSVTPKTALVQPPQSLGSIIPIQLRYGDEITKGVVEGNYNLTTRLTQVLPDERLEMGTTIVTSGEGGTYPPNLIVGKVGVIDDRDSQIFKSAEVEMLWEVSGLETLFIVRGG